MLKARDPIHRARFVLFSWRVMQPDENFLPQFFFKEVLQESNSGEKNEFKLALHLKFEFNVKNRTPPRKTICG